MNRITISPVTRLSGFLSLDITVDNGFIADAFLRGTLFRGFEKMLENRNPEDAAYFTQRICGICSTSHSIAASRALERISNVNIDENSKLIRNIIHGFDFLQNHIRQIYIFTMPDFAQIPAAGIFENDDYRLPIRLSEKISNDYERALEASRLAHQGVSIFGGKAPHNHGIVFGGVTPNLTPLDIGKASEILSKINDFVSNEMQHDMYIIESYYKDYFEIGSSYDNFISFGLFNDFKEAEISPDQYIIGGLRGTTARKDITEDSSAFDNPLNKNYESNFIIAPRYLKNPMESGPLARAMIRGDMTETSTMNRIKARGKEALLICKSLRYFIDRLRTGKNNPVGQIIDGNGTGFTDTIRGSLLHDVRIKSGKVDSYNIITPSMWNLSPEDSSGTKGPLEKALIGTPVLNPQRPIEALRTIHSYDPCISCATHIFSRNGEMLNVFNYMPW